MSLLNLANVPGNIISGMDDEVLNFVSNESSDRYLYEFSSSFLDFLSREESIDIPEEISIELAEMEKQFTPKSTMKQMEKTVERFKNFLKSNNLCDDILHIPVNVLDNYLRYFYSTLKTAEGQLYAPASLICIRAAIHRFFSANKPGVNIISDPVFYHSNKMLKAMVAKYKLSGQCKANTGYPLIEKPDMQKIRQYFDRSTPEILQEEIMFNLIYYFGLRGRETLPQLTKNSIVCETSSDGKRCLRIGHELLSKNSRASLNQKEFEDLKTARIFENKENPSECPVTAWLLYCDMISGSDILFPKPSRSGSRKQTTWYTSKQAVGKNTMDSLMTRLSQKLCLSRRYTNHCIRVTAVTVLLENGYSNTEICSFTGHKNPMSVQRYNRMKRDSLHAEMATALHQGSSKSHVDIQTVTKKAKVVTVTTAQEESTHNECKVDIHFNGNFGNCIFNVLK